MLLASGQLTNLSLGEVSHPDPIKCVQRLFAVGEMSAHTVDAFGPGASHFADHDALIAALRAELRPGINCLVKGSRSMGMEKVVHAIAARAPVREAC